MKRTSLLALVVTLILGAVVIADPKVALRYGTGEDAPNPMSKINHDEPLFLRGRNDMPHQCAYCDKGRAIPYSEVDRVFETFNAQFMNVQDR